MLRNIFIKSTIVFLITMNGIYGLAQSSPVSWETSYSDSDSSVIFTANIEEHWHVYATVLPSDEGPLPTEFHFDEMINTELNGTLIEPKPIEHYDDNFAVDVRYFENTVTYRQKITLGTSDSNKTAKLAGRINYMACNDEGCLPPVDYNFEITIPQDKP